MLTYMIFFFCFTEDWNEPKRKLQFDTSDFHFIEDWEEDSEEDSEEPKRQLPIKSGNTTIVFEKVSEEDRDNVFNGTQAIRQMRKTAYDDAEQSLIDKMNEKYAIKDGYITPMKKQLKCLKTSRKNMKRG